MCIRDSNPYAYTSGTAEELRKDAETLDKMRDSILSFYLGKCGGKTADELKEMMDAESWISRDEAKEMGFAIEDYSGELKAAASLTRRAFDKAPEAAKALMKFEARKPQETGGGKSAESTEARAEKTAGKALGGSAAKPAPADNWEARFKGLSTKFNELKAKYDDVEAKHTSELVALNAEIDNLKSQLDQSGKDLAAAQAKVSELAAKAEEDAKALLKANEDLAEVRNSLAASEDKVKHLESTRDMLTAGVLTPPESGATYADKMKAAKTAKEREELRALKKAGKIN